MNTKAEHSECYGLDRASYNQGKNAKFDFSIEDNLCPPLTARGPAAVCTVAPECIRKK